MQLGSVWQASMIKLGQHLHARIAADLAGPRPPGDRRLGRAEQVVLRVGVARVCRWPAPQPGPLTNLTISSSPGL